MHEHESALDRAFTTAMRKDAKRPKGKRWRPLPAEGEGECDYDPEKAKAYESESDKSARRGAAGWQEAEALRLAVDYALLQPGVVRGELTYARLVGVLKVSNAWRKLADELRRRKRMGG